MIRGIDSILLSTSDAKNLATFYKDVVGLKVTEEIIVGEKGEEGYGFALKSGGMLFIMDHSKVTGKNKSPERYIINFEVDDIKKEKARLQKGGAKMAQDIYHVEGYGLIATFKDIDGNFFQIVQVRAQ